MIFPLEPVIASLRDGTLPLADFLDTLEERFNRYEADLQSFVPEQGRFDRLREEARGLLDRYPDGDGRPPLFGVPVGVKDIFHVNGFVTRAGSTLPPELLQGDEAETVRQLKAAGALILGKTATTEFAYFGPGPTRNPHDRSRTPGGSSSGSAAAVGAGLCPLALGTQTIGSITRPAAFCGVIGYKPSYERVSRDGVIPLAPSLDHVGLFAWSMVDLSAAAAVLVATWRPVDAQRAPVLGIPGGPYLRHASEEAMAHFHAACEHVMARGVTVKLIDAMPDFDDVVERHQQLMAAEAAEVHEEWYQAFGDRYHAKSVELIERGRNVTGEQVAYGRAGRSQLRAELTALMNENGIDLWVSPSATGPAPAGLESTGNPIMNLPWTHCGLPTLSLPSGTTEDGLPFGCQLAGRFGADEWLFSWAVQFQAALAG